MKVILCIKQVPDVTEIRFDQDRRTVVREGVRGVINPFDKPAITLAVELGTNHGAHTTVVTMGPPQAQEALIETMGCGVSEGVHLCDRAFAGSDTLATARALAACIRQEGFDLILCGKYTVDGETAQVGPQIAELLDIPHVASVSKFSLVDGRLHLEQETDDGHEEIEVALPCLITVAEHLRPPTPPKKPLVEEARQRGVRVRSISDLGLSPDQCGAAGSPTWVAEIMPLPPIDRPKVTFLQGPSTRELALRLSAQIRESVSAIAPIDRDPVLEPTEYRETAGTGRDVLVVVERSPKGEITPGSFELLGEAANLARSLGGSSVALLAGSGEIEEVDIALCRAGADLILAVEHDDLATYTAEGHTDAVCAAIAARVPSVVLFSSTEKGRSLAPRVAARLGLGLTGDAIGLRLTEDGQNRLVQLKPAFAGNFVAPILSRTMPQMATLRPGMLKERAPNDRRPTRRIRLPLTAPPKNRVQVQSRTTTTDESSARLSRARVVVGIGMGLGDKTNFHLAQTLATTLGAAICTTRRVTDKGWLPRQIQVGLTGKIIAPDVYIAIGIRGVTNHTIGIQRAKIIFAINKDERAQIFGVATYGIIADCLELLPMLNEELAKKH